MRTRGIIVAIWMGMCVAAGCEKGPDQRTRAARTIGLVRELSRCVNELTEADREALIQELRTAGQSRPNGSNQALLAP